MNAWAATALVLAAMLAPQRLAAAPPNVEIVLDASGSMWGRLEGDVPKIETAKSVLGELVDGLPDDARVALRAYGHRTEGDCSDIELLVAMGPKDEAALARALAAVSPKGKTPITAALRAALADFGDVAGRNLVVLVSDGKETCEGDPCEAVRELRAAGVEAQVHVVGFDVTEEQREQLRCVAEAGGGRYYDAQSASAFREAVSAVQADVVAAPAAPATVNLIAAERGGQVLLADQELWLRTIDGDEARVAPFFFEGERAVFAFQGERRATFDRFAMLIPGASGNNPKEFALGVADDSPRGPFRSLGRFTTQNVRLLANPYQEFTFPETTARYLEVELLTTHQPTQYFQLHELRLEGRLEGEETAKSSAPPDRSRSPNVLAAASGGTVVAAAHERWTQTIDGSEAKVAPFSSIQKEEAVFAFAEGKPARFDAFEILIPAASGFNLREFELFAGDAPGGPFRPLGRFETLNARWMRSPYQRFSFEPVTAPCFKVKLLTTHGESYVALHELRLLEAE
jgi:hypothetical protein